MSTISSLSQFLLKHLSDHPEQKELIMLVNDLSEIGKTISRQTNKAGLVGILGSAGSINIQNEEVQKLDVFSNELCKNILKDSEHIASMASEEEDSVADLSEHGSKAKYIIAFDPLDGSSNIDVNVSIGTIFSVHKKLEEFDRTDESQFFQKGHSQVLAGYILYGSSTVLVFSFGNGVHEFTLDPDTTDFYLSNERITMPDSCPYYSLNEGNSKYMTNKDRLFVQDLKESKGCGSRYIGSLVADIHRTLIKGGVFMYPALDNKGTGEYKGKLRLNFELKTMAFLIEQAGGMAIDGEKNILDIVPKHLHERTPFIAGNKKIIEDYLNK